MTFFSDSRKKTCKTRFKTSWCEIFSILPEPNYSIEVGPADCWYNLLFCLWWERLHSVSVMQILVLLKILVTSYPAKILDSRLTWSWCWWQYIEAAWRRWSAKSSVCVCGRLSFAREESKSWQSFFVEKYNNQKIFMIYSPAKIIFPPSQKRVWRRVPYIPGWLVSGSKTCLSRMTL